MVKLTCLLIISCLFLECQAQGVLFSQNLNWQDVLQKAKTEQKYIFVDCYATWCGPCKIMDRQVYSNDTIGKFINEHFVSIKVQMDSTNNDPKEVQNWYRTAQDLERKYSVLAYPSFLFFSPDGLIVHKDIGAKSVQEFLHVVQSAMDSRSGFYRLLSLYQQGNLRKSDLVNLANTADGFGQDSLALTIAKHYIDQYLDSLPESQIWTKGNVEFITHYQKAIISGSRLFQLYFQDRKMIDSIMQKPRYTDGLINYVVYGEDVAPGIKLALTEHNEPLWPEMEKVIEKKYGKEYVQNNVLRGKVDFYKANKEWRKYVKYIVLRYEFLGVRKMPPSIGISYLLNDRAYEVFTYSNSKKDLKIALLWVNRALEMDEGPDPAALDTKANLLYKLGKYDEGIALEKQAVELSPANGEIRKNFNKMQKRIPTWLM